VHVGSGVASPKIGEGAKNLGETKMHDFRRNTIFCLEKRLSKHKITIFPLPPPATPMRVGLSSDKESKGLNVRVFQCLRD